MNKYESFSICPKCGGSFPSSKYYKKGERIPPSGLSDILHIQVETDPCIETDPRGSIIYDHDIIHRICKTCGYGWDELPLNCGEK